MSDLTSQTPCRRFGWYRPNPGGKFDLHSLHEPLNENVWREFERFVLIVRAVRPYLLDWFALNADADEIAAICAEDNEASEDGRLRALPTSPVSVSREAEVQRRFLHLVTSAEGFRTRATASLSAKFGPTSDQISAFDAAIAFWYDHSFGFRLIFELRKFLEGQHLPIASRPAPAQENTVGQPKVSQRVFHIRLSPIAHSAKIAPSVRTELLAVPGQVTELSGLIPACLSAYGGLMLRILEFYDYELIELIQYTAGLYDKLNIPAGAVAVVWEGRPEEADPRFQRRAIELHADDVQLILALHQRLRQGPLAPDS